jgi:hypothetical protein
LLWIKRALMPKLSIKMTTKALPKKAPQKANATNAAAATAMAVTVVSVMVIVQSVLSVRRISLLSPQRMMALLKLCQCKLSLSIHVETLLQPQQLLL